MPSPAVRLSSHERREAVVRAAAREFAIGGYAGTSTEAIARRAGVSQPYLFQLFGTKRRLFIAVVRLCFARTASTFEETGRAAAPSPSPSPTAVLKAMGHGYIQLLKDRQLLQLQLQCYAACNDPAIRAVVQKSFAELYGTVARISGASPTALRDWFATGMLLNVAAAIGDPNSKKPLSMAALINGRS